MQVRIITIDGPSGSGKGTIANLVAKRLGWRCLDSGALYRLVGLAVKRAGISIENVAKVNKIVRNMDITFSPKGIRMGGEDVTDAIRTEEIGNTASKVAAIPKVRAELLAWQRDYACDPGLVADGRDMGTIVFPEAALKIFLTASAEERAKRRYKQLKEKGLDVNLNILIEEIRKRDDRDRNRSVAPLKAADDALVVESTRLSIQDVFNRILERIHIVFPDLDVSGA